MIYSGTRTGSPARIPRSLLFFLFSWKTIGLVAPQSHSLTPIHHRHHPSFPTATPHNQDHQGVREGEESASIDLSSNRFKSLVHIKEGGPLERNPRATTRATQCYFVSRKSTRSCSFFHSILREEPQRQEQNKTLSTFFCYLLCTFVFAFLLFNFRIPFSWYPQMSCISFFARFAFLHCQCDTCLDKNKSYNIPRVSSYHCNTKPQELKIHQ